MTKLLVISEPGEDGVKRHVIDILNNINLSDFQVEYVYSLSRQDKIYKSEIQSLITRGVRCINLNIKSNLHYSDVIFINQIYKLIKSGNYGIIHCHSGKAGLIGRIAAVLARRQNKLFYTPNAFPFQNESNPIKKHIYLFAERMLAKVTNTIICVSLSELEEAKKIVNDSRKLELVENGVDTVRYTPSWTSELEKKKLGFDRSETLILTVGRMEYQKNPMYIYNSLKVFYEQHGALARFVHIGTGSYLDEVRRFVSENALDELITIVSYTDKVEEYLKAADVFMLLSKYEGLSIALLEAMSCGCAVIASDVTGIKDVLHGDQNEFIIKSENPKIVADKLYKLVSNQSTLAKMQKANHQLITASYSIKKMVKKLECVYRK